MAVTLLWVSVHPRGVEERGGDFAWVDRSEKTQHIARHAIEPGGHTYLNGRLRLDRREPVATQLQSLLLKRTHVGNSRLDLGVGELAGIGGHLVLAILDNCDQLIVRGLYRSRILE